MSDKFMALSFRARWQARRDTVLDLTNGKRRRRFALTAHSKNHSLPQGVLPKRRASRVVRLGPQLFFDAQQLIVFRDSI